MNKCGQWLVVGGQCASGSAAAAPRAPLTRRASQGALPEDPRSRVTLVCRAGACSSSSPIPNPQSPTPRRPRHTRRAFTLVELLITVSVIAIMASMVLFAMFSAQEMARASKTKALIAKLDAIIKAKWDGYRTRRVPINIPPGTPPQAAAQMRLDGLRDLMRMELPDRWSDIEDPPVLTTMQRPAAAQAYFRRWNAASPKPSNEYAGAECLYLIVTAAQAEDADDRSLIKADNVGDKDEDGFPEFLDGWGMPIRFLRWAPGFPSELQVSLFETASGGPPTITVSSNRLSSTPGSYIGGAMYAEDPDPANPGNLLTTNPARITGYTFTPGTPGTGSFTIESAAAFTMPTGKIFVLPPDPFDSRGVYRPITALPSASFALYPLIYSPGPNKVNGIVSGYDPMVPPGALRYRAVGANPFYDLAGRPMMGTPEDLPADPNFVPRGWVDNIHNHQITSR